LFFGGLLNLLRQHLQTNKDLVFWETMITAVMGEPQGV